MSGNKGSPGVTDCDGTTHDEITRLRVDRMFDFLPSRERREVDTWHFIMSDGAASPFQEINDATVATVLSPVVIDGLCREKAPAPPCFRSYLILLY